MTTFGPTVQRLETALLTSQAVLNFGFLLMKPKHSPKSNWLSMIQLMSDTSPSLSLKMLLCKVNDTHIFYMRTDVTQNRVLASICESKPCQNSGVCVPDNASGNRTCSCPAGFSGSNCETAQKDNVGWKQVNFAEKTFFWRHIGQLEKLITA